MSGFVPTEGRTLAAEVLVKRDLTDRDADLELILFTNASVDLTITAAALTQPTGTGYAPIELDDASWVNAAGIATYAQQTFTGGAGGWTGAVRGYAIITIAAGGTPRCLAIEVDEDGPFTIGEGDVYRVTPQITKSSPSP